MRKLIILLSGVAFLALSACNRNQNLSDGYGNFDAHAEVIVSAQTMGQLLQFNVEEGDYLKTGQLVGLVDTLDLHLKKEVLMKQKTAVASQLINVKATIIVQKQQLAINKINQRRIQNLFKSHAATQKQLDDINGLVDLNRKQIKATRTREISIAAEMKSIMAQVASVNETINKCLIKNDVPGTVLVKYAEKGELATPGKPLYKIANLKTLELKAYVSGSDLNRIKIGQQVKVYYDKNKTENREVNGRIIWISPFSEFTPKTIQTKDERVNLVYAVKIKVPNQNGAIKIGMPGEFKIMENTK